MNMSHLSQQEFKNARKHLKIWSITILSFFFMHIDNRKGKKYLEMTDFIFSGVTAEKVHRIDVNFNFQERLF